MPAVVLLGTLDTKGIEFAYVRDRLRAYGCQVILIDVGLVGAPQAEPDITRDAVAAAGGTTVAALLARDDRGAALEAMAGGATRLVADLNREGRLHALLSLGGSGGSSIAAAAMRALPIGVPKLLVSTIASGDVSSYVGQSDITMMHAVLDVAGLNAVSTAIYDNAAAAAAGMAGAFASRTASQDQKPAVAVTMFGVTTPAVTTARQWLEAHGYEVFVFHANGAGGRAMEKLISEGSFVGVIDLTTTELADELLGGDLSAGPSRLTAGGERGGSAGRLAGGAGHGQFRATGPYPCALPRSSFLQAQPERHTDAHHLRGMCGARARSRSQAQCCARARDAVHTARRNFFDF